MHHHCVTPGEMLSKYLYAELIPTGWWEKFQKVLGPTGRDVDLCDFFRLMTAIQLAGRLIKGGRSGLSTLHIDSPEFDAQLQRFLTSYPLFGFNENGKLFRFIKRAIEASEESIANGVRTKVRGWAKQAHQHCYMCGTAMDFIDPESHIAFTIDHIWPASYGGNSSIENLLPACASCNHSKKGDYAAWVMCDVQSLIFGIDPSDAVLGDIHGSHKFALHSRAAFALAYEKQISLREAYMKLGPWSHARIRDNDDVCDFFNLENQHIA